MGSEKLIAVGDNGERKSVFTIPVGEEKVCGVFCAGVSSSRYESEIRIEVVSNGQEAVESIVVWKGANEVHGDGITTFIGNQQRV